MPGSLDAIPVYNPIQISKMVLSIVKSGPPTPMVDRTILQMRLASPSTHRGISTPVVGGRESKGQQERHAGPNRTIKKTMFEM